MPIDSQREMTELDPRSRPAASTVVAEASSADMPSASKGAPVAGALAIAFDATRAGKEIAACVDRADRAKQRSDDLFISAGRLLMEARQRVPNFRVFLRKECSGLSASRAYQLIRLAKGEVTVDEERAKAARRMRKHRAAKCASRDAQPTINAGSGRALLELYNSVKLWSPQLSDNDLATFKAVVAALKLSASNGSQMHNLKSSGQIAGGPRTAMQSR